MSEHGPLVTAETLILPIDPVVELRLLGEDMRPQLHALIVKNKGHLKPWVSWADTVSPDNDNVTGWLISATSYPMGIFVEGQLSGMVDIRDLQNPQGAEVGVWVDEDHVGQGLATRSLAALIDFAHSEHSINRFRYNTYEQNVRSSAVAEKLGFRLASSGFDADGQKEKRFVKDYEASQHGVNEGLKH